MSIQTLTILQFIGVLAAYLGMTVLLPAFVFNRRFRDERFCVRFMIYLVIGNVYLMNLVLVLQLLHISNRITLFLGTVLPAVWALARVHNTTVKDGVLSAARAVNSFLTGTMGGRLLLSKAIRSTGRLFKTAFLRVAGSIRHNFFDWLFTVGVIGLILWQYGCNMFWNMGYCFSDMPVHNYWINALNDNRLFVSGVYPQGFHCIIYYLHKMFGFYTYVLLRMFGLVETLMIHLMLLAFMKACCRTRYTPYMGMILYLFANVWNIETYKRYSSALPQEFGMIYILPSIYFLIAFFEDRKKENGAKGWKVHSTRYLLFFGLSFSATLAIHFYNTIIAGLFCVAVAIGFMGLLFRKAYFGRIMVAGLLSVLLAVLPMGIAFATGTPPEGSLRWAMAVMTGKIDSSGNPVQTQQETSGENAQDGEDGSQGSGSGQSGEEASGQGSPQGSGQDGEEASGQGVTTGTGQAGNGEQDGTAGSGQADGGGAASQGGGNGSGQTLTDGASQPQENQPPPEPKVPASVRLKAWVNEKWGKTVRFLTGLRNGVNLYILSNASPITVAAVLVFTVIPGCIGFINLFMRKTRHYGCVLITMAFCVILLYAVMMARWLGIPALMDQSRCSIYLAYTLSAAVVFAIDAMISLAAGWVTTQFIADMLSLGGVGLMVSVLLISRTYRLPLDMPALESNDAIICLTNILHDNQRFMFTVISANDELRMVENDGYHYETINFLRAMEGENQEAYLTIPTPRIYIYIEKIPIDYAVSYEGSGTRISASGASRPLPQGGGLGVYQGRNRYTVMSRLYYWALAFQSLYPNEMRVYYETTDFVCYEIDQNPYRLFDLSIDYYGYNSKEY